MALYNKKEVTCPCCDKKHTLLYGYNQMKSDTWKSGYQECECGLIISCNPFGDEESFTVINERLINEIKPDVKLDENGKLIIGIADESQKKLLEYFKKINKLINIKK
jgi:nitrate reductase NapAB chaperone NapD